MNDEKEYIITKESVSGRYELWFTRVVDLKIEVIVHPATFEPHTRYVSSHNDFMGSWDDPNLIPDLNVTEKFWCFATDDQVKLLKGYLSL